MALNLEKQLRFGHAHQSQGTNTPPLVKLPSSMNVPYLDLNAGTILCLCYCALYVLLEPVAGMALSVLLLAGTAYGKYLTVTHGMAANFWAIAGFLAGWIVQFLGHGMFEGRAPALLDNIFQAFFLAPLFVWMELLFALGYRPELKSRLDKMVKEDIAKYRESKAQKANGKVNGAAVNGNGHAKQS
ncbi:hypothetical protein LTR10_024088 [Elasticomyces elasticus]|uniref:DUF962 domain-containing protein n=1 Tax=Exophiala sideris TaxID=1016849 RepID=A0ABR0J8K9_9EURO|nr:hypothetical protein LTR10_024088 [Elasticomyces elasticus]KAK5027996.1 hypothetical protein LTS07_006872 [Exophiala sideris]KAK5037414.1 hypothetical protein LTR13_004571 [Exophiala sideris]KAK5059076.1 hypothetical protein LTR69_006365 [Exophiala sideris]KAK5182909.1 hypothetical protein LTR44_004619 [Eurotiomycetes sp. CCFEE 6388]